MTTTIWERVETALTPLGIPFGARNYLPDPNADWPNTYMSYLVVSINPEVFLNDVEKYRSYLVQVSIYKKNTLVGLPDVIGAMKTGGFTFSGGRELESEETEETHLGIAFDFEYMEKI